jgi:hypothetical protein
MRVSGDGDRFKWGLWGVWGLYEEERGAILKTGQGGGDSEDLGN